MFYKKSTEAKHMEVNGKNDDYLENLIMDNFAEHNFDDNDFDVDHNEYEFDVDLEIFHDIDVYLPYEREYSSLTPQDLIKLINEAYEKNWKALDLSQCGLKDIPPEIGILTELEILDLSNHMIFDESLEVNSLNNMFTTLPVEFGNLKKLTHLNLYHTGLKYLPNEFSELTNLKYLNLNGEDFKEFPEQILRLRDLRKLAINKSFSYIPEEIGNLQELEKLYLPDSSITALPESIGRLPKLEVLYLGRSSIKQIPNSFASLKSLKKISLEGSAIADYIPPEIFSQTPIQIIDYILRYQNDNDKVILNESKMIIVGQGGVGKTCLLNRIVNNKYVDSVSTEGIDIAHWCFESDGIEYQLNVWDFGGQEIYHSTHQFFLTERSLYIFVWDARQEEEYGRIDYWLNTIQSFANDSPIIIVVNKCDETRKNVKSIDFEDLKKNFPQIINLFNVSCRDNINIEYLRQEIVNQAKNLPLMKTIWFSTWVSIRKDLEELSKTKNIINFDEYLVICSKHEIYDLEAVSLIKYLHDLGVVLYFHEDILLRNIVILSPEWGTDAVYKILDAQANILKDRNGILYSDDLSDIWDNVEIYPKSIYPYILKLMEKFQLSFIVENQKQTYLVAELLDNTEKNIPLEFANGSTLNFRYEYKFLPAGIMTGANRGTFLLLAIIYRFSIMMKNIRGIIG